MKFLGLADRKEVEVAGGGVVSIPSADSKQDREHQATKTAFTDTRLKLKPKEVLHVLIQLKAMLGAGVPLLAAIRTLVQHAVTPGSRKMLEQIAMIIEDGNDLSYAFDCFPRSIPKFIVHLLAAGERSGALEDSLARGSELLDKQIRLSGKIKGALAYPGFLMVATGCLTCGILIFLVPKFETILMSRPELLPSSTKLVLAGSNFLRQSPELAGTSVGVLVFLMILILKNQRLRRAAFDLFSHLPVVGNVIHKAYISRSVNTLAMTLESGVPILTGLEHAKEVSELPRLQAHWEGAAAVVRDGRPMHTALAEADLPPALIQMIVAGESSGSLDSSLRTAASFLDRETEAAMGVFTGLLGPATVMIAGAVVGFIVVALMMPILQMSKFVG